MDDRQLTALERKLKALNYHEKLDPSSAPLVRKILDDVIHTTESYRTLKLQCAKQAHEINSFGAKFDLVKEESAKAHAENNQLHAQILKESEKFQKKEKSHYTEQKRLEDQIAELNYWKRHAIEQFTLLEKENDLLKQRLGELLKTSDKVNPSSAIDVSKLNLSDPIRVIPTPVNKLPKSSVDLLQVANSRIISLQQQLNDKNRELSELLHQANAAQEQLNVREQEIKRISSVTPDVDRVTLEKRNEANETMILSLNTQIESLCGQLAEMEAREKKGFVDVDDVERMQSEADERLQRAVQENSTILQELQSLKSEWLALQADWETKEMKAPVRNEKKAAGSGADIQQLQRVVAERDASLAQASGRLAELTSELETRTSAYEQLQEERKQAFSRLEELQARLESVETSAKRLGNGPGGTAVDERVKDELRACHDGLAQRDQEIVSLRGKIEGLAGSGHATLSSLAELEQKCGRLERELSALHAQLEDERKAAAQLRSNCTTLEVEAERKEAQLAAVQADRRRADEAVESARAAATNFQERALAAERQVASLTAATAREGERGEQMRKTVVRLAEAEAEVSRLRSELSRSSASLQSTEARLKEANHELQKAQEAFEDQRLKAETAEHANISLSASLRSLEEERGKTADEYSVLVSELDMLRTRLQQEADLARDADTSVHELNQKIASVTKALSMKEEECSQLQSLCETLQAGLDACRGREEDVTGQVREWTERARRAETLAMEHGSEIEELHQRHEADAAELRELETLCSSLRADLDQRSREVEQLTTLSLHGDATVQEYMANLKSMSLELKASEVKARDLEAKLSAREDALHQAQLDLEEMRRAVGVYESEHGNLHSELESKSEQMQMLMQEVEANARSRDETSRMLAMTENRLAASEQRCQELLHDAEALKSQLEGTLGSLEATTGEQMALREEVRALSEDLEVLVKENQVVTGELATACHARDNATSDVRRLSARVQSAEASMRAREQEMEDLRRVYEALALEQKRTHANVVQLEREALGREQALAVKGDEVASLTEALRAANAQANSYVVDLQAFERQVDTLSRELAAAESRGEDMGQERESLLGEIRTVTQIRLTLERQREELQRGLSAAEGQNHTLRMRLEDAGKELEELKQRIMLERGRVGELETLVGSMRAREFSSSVTSSGVREMVAAAQDRTRVAEERAESSSAEARALKKRVEALEKELERMSLQAAQPSGRASADGRSQELGVAEAQLSQVKAELAGALEVQASLRQQVQALSRTNAAASGGANEQEVRKLHNDLAQLQSEHARLMGVLETLDAEQNRLKRENESLEHTVASLRARPLGDLGEQELNRLKAQVQELQRGVNEEQSRRRQAEQDFLELMESLERDQGEASPSLIWTRKVEALQARVNALEEEKKHSKPSSGEVRKLDSTFEMASQSQPTQPPMAPPNYSTFTGGPGGHQTTHASYPKPPGPPVHGGWGAPAQSGFPPITPTEEFSGMYGMAQVPTPYTADNAGYFVPGRY